MTPTSTTLYILADLIGEHDLQGPYVTVTAEHISVMIGTMHHTATGQLEAMEEWAAVLGVPLKYTETLKGTLTVRLETTIGTGLRLDVYAPIPVSAPDGETLPAGLVARIIAGAT